MPRSQLDAGIDESVHDRAMDRRTGFPPHQIIFFDDLKENTQAARAAGWHAHTIDHTNDPAAQMRAYLREAHLVNEAR